MELAKYQDLPALTALWHTCFGDAPADIEHFWEEMFSHLQVYVARVRGKAVAMVCALPTILVEESGDSTTCAYLYAVCTHPDYRGRGICSRLLAYAEQQEARSGMAFAALVPEGADKFDFYQKRGYTTCFYHKKYQVAAGGSAEIQPLETDDYFRLRSLQLYGGYLSHGRSVLRWQDDLGRRSGAGLFRIETEDVVCCAAAERRDQTLVIKELLPDDAAAAAALAAHLGCTGAEVRSSGGEIPFGMLKTLRPRFGPQPERLYLGIAMD